MRNKKELIQDQELVIKIAQGDEKAYEQLFRLYSKKIYHTSKKMNLCHEDAEGIVQEVFLIIWKNRINLDPSFSINAYMLTIAKSLIIRKAQKDAKLVAYQKYNISNFIDYTNNTEECLLHADLHQISKKILSHLPSGQRKIFIMRTLEDMPTDEIAYKLKLSKRTVENQIFRATKFMREKLLKMKIIELEVVCLLANVLMTI